MSTAPDSDSGTRYGGPFIADTSGLPQPGPAITPPMTAEEKLIAHIRNGLKAGYLTTITVITSRNSDGGEVMGFTVVNETRLVTSSPGS